MNRWLFVAALALSNFAVRPDLVSAQATILPYPPRPYPPRPYPPRPNYPYPTPYPSNPYYPLPYDNGGSNNGNYLSGAADLNRSYGDLTVQNEKARVIQQKAAQEKIQTKKMAFDQMLYEKANTPTYTEILTKENALILNRRMNFPTRGEIVSGVTLNTMLPFLQALSTYGTQGPPIGIPQQVVYALNISNSGTSSVGMLRDGGRVVWPVSLRGPQQQKLDKLLPVAYDATLTGNLDAKLLNRVRAEMKDMRQTLREQLQNEQIDGSSYMQAIEFFNALDSSINALDRPDARQQLDGAYTPRARNVQELVDFMTEKGLKFAPASPGSENAYQSAHDAFVRYARTAQASASTQANNMPIGPAAGGTK